MPEVEERKKKIAATLFMTGSNAVKTNQLDYAIDSFLKATKLDPEKLMYRQSLRGTEHAKYNKNGKGATGAGMRTQGTRMTIKYAKARKKWQDVIDSCEECLTLNPWDVEILLELCNACKELGETMLDTGLWTAQNATTADKENHRGWRMYAYFCEQKKMYNEALNALEKVKNLDPGDMEIPTKIRQLAATSTISAGRYEEEDKPEGEGEEGGESETPQPKATPKIQHQAPETSDQKALREIKEAKERIAADGPNPVLYLQIVENYRRINDQKKATDTLEEAVKALPDDPDIKMAALDNRIEYARREIDNAEQKMAAKSKDDPGYEKYQADGQKFIDGRKLKITQWEADRYRIRIAETPQDWGSWLELGERLITLKQYDDAIKALQNGRNDGRQKWRALRGLGAAFWQKRNFTLAEKNLKDALTVCPSMNESGKKDIWYNLGRVYDDKGDREAAIEAYNEVAAIEYGYLDIAERLERLTGDGAGE